MRGGHVARCGVVVAVLIVLAGCGYHVAGRGEAPRLASLGIPLFLNRSFDPNVETLLTTYLRERFAQSRRIAIVPPENAEAVLEGVVRAVSKVPVSFSRGGLVVEERAEIVVDALVRRQADGRVLWRGTGLRFAEEYVATATVPVNRRHRDEAIARAAWELSGRIHEAILSGF